MKKILANKNKITFMLSVFRQSGMRLQANPRVPLHQVLPLALVQECGSRPQHMLPLGQLPQEERLQDTRVPLVPGGIGGMKHQEQREVKKRSSSISQRFRTVARGSYKANCISSWSQKKTECFHGKPVFS